MRILAIHNHYQQLGGEDTIFATEADLLESYGHQVRRYTVHNDRINEMSPLALAQAAIWNNDTYQDLKRIIREERPHIAHFHNTFPLISPAAYYAAQSEGVAVIQTLHNYRLLCPNGLFFRDGRVCEDCLGKRFPSPGILHRCYRENRVASTAVASMVSFHTLIGTWVKAVDVFIAYSQFALAKFIEGGLPREKFEFKTNFLYPAPEPGDGQGGYALFVGRLSPEKGILTFLEAWQSLGEKIPLKIVGDGPLASQVTEVASRYPGIEWLGRLPLPEVYELMGSASFLVFPSEWYETFGRVAIEAYAKGTPIIAADIGAVSELVMPYETGLRFQPGSSSDLIKKVEWFLNHPVEAAQMRQNVRLEFEQKYTAPENYRRLMEIYQLAPSKKGATISEVSLAR